MSLEKEKESFAKNDFEKINLMNNKFTLVSPTASQSNDDRSRGPTELSNP